MAQVHVLTGPERRRRFSVEEKRAIVAAAFAPGAVVSNVARRADVCPSLIYRWRRELGALPGGFAEVILAPVIAGDYPSVSLAEARKACAEMRDMASAAVTVEGAAERFILARARHIKSGTQLEWLLRKHVVPHLVAPQLRFLEVGRR